MVGSCGGESCPTPGGDGGFPERGQGSAGRCPASDRGVPASAFRTDSLLETRKPGTCLASVDAPPSPLTRCPPRRPQACLPGRRGTWALCARPTPLVRVCERARVQPRGASWVWGHCRPSPSWFVHAAVGRSGRRGCHHLFTLMFCPPHASRCPL